MFSEFIANNVSAIVAAVALLPALLISLAMFLEGARKLRWTAPARSGGCATAR